MDTLRGYRVFRQDPEWGSKLMVASVLFFSTAFIPIVGQIVLTGWQALVLRRAVRGEVAPLPRLDFDFQYFGKLLGVGFKGFVARFIWSLPLVFLFTALFTCLYAGVVVAAISAAESGNDELIPIFMVACMLVGVVVMLPLAVLLAIPANVAAMRAELTDDMSRGLQFGEVMAFTRRHLGALFKGSMILGIVGFFAVMLGLLACYVGAFVAAVLGLLAHAHFMAQIYELHVREGGEALPVAAGDLDEPAPAPPAGAWPPA